MSETTNRRISMSILDRKGDLEAPFMRMSVSVVAEDETGDRISSVGLDLDLREQQGAELATWILLHLPDPAAVLAAMSFAVQNRTDLRECVASLRDAEQADADGEVKS